MTTYYLATDGDNSDGLTWAKAWTMPESVPTLVAGDIVWVDKDGQFSAAAIVTLHGLFTPTAELPYYIPVDRTGDPEPPVSNDYAPMTTGHFVSTTSRIDIDDGAQYDGLYLKSAADFRQEPGSARVIYRDCTYEFTTVDDKYLHVGTGSRMHFDGCTYKSVGGVTDDLGGLSYSGSYGQSIIIDGGDFTDTSLEYKTYLIQESYRAVKFTANDCDFSLLGQTASTVYLLNNITDGNYTFNRCKLPTNSGFAIGTFHATNAGKYGPRAEFLGCDDGSDQERDIIFDVFGDLDTWGGGIASRAVYRDSGFTRKDQTNPTSWRIETTAKTSFSSTFKLFPISVYNETTGSTRKITIEYLLGDASATDDLDYSQMWMVVSYYDDAGVMQVRETNREHTAFASPTSHATSTEAWTVTDAESNTAKRKMELTTSGTVAQEGWISVDIYLADMGTNDSIYIDPMATVGAA